MIKPMSMRKTNKIVIELIFLSDHYLKEHNNKEFFTQFIVQNTLLEDDVPLWLQ